MSEVTVTLKPKGTEAITRAIDSYDKAMGRSADQAKANAKKAETALDSHIKKQRELTGKVRELKDELANADKGSDNFKRLQKEIRETAEAERDAKDKAKLLKSALDEASTEAETAANSIKGLGLRLKEAEKIAQQADLGSDEAKRADKAVADLQAALKELKSEHKATARAVDVHANSVKGLEKELHDATDEMNRLDRSSDTFAKQAKKVARLNRELAKTKAGVNGVTSEGNRLTKVTGALGNQVLGLAAGFVGVSEAVQAVRYELEKASRIEKDSATKTRSVEESLADVAFNIGGENLGNARELIDANFKRLGTTQEGLANLIGIAVSAGAEDVQAAMAVAESALKTTAGNADKAIEATQTAIDIASLSDSDNFDGALGQVSQTQSVVRAVDSAAFFGNISPALATATGDKKNIDGISTERTLEIASVFSQVLKDRQGSNTATGIRQFITRLDSFVPELSASLKDGTDAKIPKDIIAAFKSTRSVDERVDLFRANPGLRNQFLDQQKEGIGKTAQREFIEGTKRALEFEDKAKRTITGIDEAEGSYKALVKAIDENTSLLQSDNRASASIAEFQSTGENALNGQVIKEFEDVINQLDLPGLDYATDFAASASLQASGKTDANLATVAKDLLELTKGDTNASNPALNGTLVGAALSSFDYFSRDLGDNERKLVDDAKAELTVLEEKIKSLRERAELNRVAPVDKAGEARPVEKPDAVREVDVTVVTESGSTEPKENQETAKALPATIELPVIFDRANDSVAPQETSKVVPIESPSPQVKNDDNSELINLVKAQQAESKRQTTLLEKLVSKPDKEVTVISPQPEARVINPVERNPREGNAL